MNQKNLDRRNYIGFRLSENDLKKLDMIVKQENKSRGLIAKEGLQEWIDLQLYNQNNNIISVSKTFFIHLLSFINKDNKEDIATELGDIMADILRFLVAKPMNIDTLPIYIQFVLNLFGKTGLRWFNSLNIEMRNSTLVFKGIHDLKGDFSNFFAFFFKYLLSKNFNINLYSEMEEITSNFIHLDFKFSNFE